MTQEPPRILCIEDNRDQRYFFACQLREAGITNPVDFASGGADGLDYLQQCLDGAIPWPCVVFLDIKMPLDGFEVLSWAKEQGAIDRTVFAVLSSYSDPNDIERAFSEGAHAYLTKASDAKDLGEVIEAATRWKTRDEWLTALARFRPVGNARLP